MMAAPSVFVNYHFADPTHRDHQFAMRLVTDLRERGADVVVGGVSTTDRHFVQRLNQELPSCQWFVLVESPDALRSPGVQRAVQRALELEAQGCLQGVLALLVAPCDPQDVPASWKQITTLDATREYSEALALLRLALREGQQAVSLSGIVWQTAAIADNGPVLAVVADPYTPFDAQMEQREQQKKTANRQAEPVWGKGISWDSLPRSYRSLQRSRRLRLISIAALVVVILGVAGFAAAHFKREPDAAISLLVPATASPTPQMQGTALQVPTAAQGMIPQTLYTSIISKTPALNDALSAQDGNRWDVHAAHGAAGGCVFAGKAYHASVRQPDAYVACAAQVPNFQNFAYQVRMNFVKGDAGGLVFRAKGLGGNHATFYRFSLDVAGHYRLIACQNCALDQNGGTRLAFGQVPINAKQTNTLAVIAQGPMLYLYVNGQFVSSARDGSSAQGAIGVYAVDLTQSTEVSFWDAKVWRL